MTQKPYLNYDTDSNTLYLVAKKVKYSFIRTLQKPDEKSNGNLISYVAHNESLEEFFGNPEFCHEPLSKQLLHAEFKMEPQGINAIAIRRAKNSLRTEIEFIRKLTHRRP